MNTRYFGWSPILLLALACAGNGNDDPKTPAQAQLATQESQSPGKADRSLGKATTQASGALAPDFTLNKESGQPVRLSDFKGKRPVLLAFYPKDFTGG